MIKKFTVSLAIHERPDQRMSFTVWSLNSKTAIKAAYAKATRDTKGLRNFRYTTKGARVKP